MAGSNLGELRGNIGICNIFIDGFRGALFGRPVSAAARGFEAHDIAFPQASVAELRGKLFRRAAADEG